MNYETNMAYKLRQTMINQDSNNKLKKAISNVNMISKIDSLPSFNQPTLHDPLLPSISNTKVNIIRRTKSQSQKKFKYQRIDFSQKKSVSIKKNNQQNNRTRQKQAIFAKKVDVGQQILQTKKMHIQDFPTKGGSFISKNITPTKTKRMFDTTQAKSSLIINSAQAVQQFLQNSNENLLLNVKSFKIEENADYKRFITLINKMKAIDCENILRFLNYLSIFIRQFRINSALIQTKSIVKLSPKKKPSNHDILSVFLNKNSLIKPVKIPGLQYYTDPPLKGRHLAATKIQSLFRMHSCICFTRKLKSLLGKVKTIQRHWKNLILVKRTRQTILAAITQKIKYHNEIQSKFIQLWPIIKTSPKVQIHICSYSLEEFKRMTISNLQQRQMSSLSRIFRAAQTDTDIIMILPAPIDNQVQRYFRKVLGFAASTAQQKVYFVVPENYDKFPEHPYLTTTAKLIYSPKALKKIKNIIGKKYSFIIPSFPSPQYTNLSAILQIPLYSSSQPLSKLLSSKSGSHSFFSNLKSAPFTLPMTVTSIFSEQELINSLAIGIIKNKDVEKWWLKIDDEINGRGLAWLQVSKIGFIRQLCREKHSEIDEKDQIRVIAQQLSDKLRIRLKVMHRQIYGSPSEYLTHFLTRGGVVQAQAFTHAQPISLLLHIDPIGDFSLLTTYSKLELGGKSAFSIIIPGHQIKLEKENAKRIDLQSVGRSIWKGMRAKGMFGFFQIDLLFEEDSNQIAAIGLDCFMNERASSFFLGKYITNCNFSKENNTLYSPVHPTLTFLQTSSLTFSALPSFSMLFKTLKLHSLSFMPQTSEGLLFLPSDLPQHGMIGLIAISEKTEEAISKFGTAISKMEELWSKEEDKKQPNTVKMMKGIVKMWCRKLTKKQTPSIQPNLQQFF